jgi:hypothetical protein
VELREMNLYLKSLLAIGVPSTLFIVIVIIYLGGSLDEVLYFGTLTFAIFGLLAFVFSFIQVRLSKRIQPEKPEEAQTVHHVREIELQLPYNDAFNMCRESLASIQYCAIKKKDLSQGKIVAEKVPSWRSMGEVITFDIKQVNARRTHIIVSSKPLLRTTIIDWGKNLENVQKITQYLRERGGHDIDV